MNKQTKQARDYAQMNEMLAETEISFAEGERRAPQALYNELRRVEAEQERLRAAMGDDAYRAATTGYEWNNALDRRYNKLITKLIWGE